MGSSRFVPISCPVGRGRHADPDERSRSRRARDRHPPAALGRAAAHRVEAEVTRMSGGRVEAPPVVADLEDNLALLGFSDSASRGSGPRTSMIRPSEARAPEACLASAATSPS